MGIKTPLIFPALFIIYIISCCQSQGQNLTANFLPPLPMGLYLSVPFYDGLSDSIYIFGGIKEHYTEDQILLFDISSSTTTHVGRLIEYFRRVSVQSDNSGNMFGFGGGAFYRSVYKYSPQLNRTFEVAKIPYDADYSTSIKIEGSEQVLIFGGSGNRDGISLFDMTTGTFTPYVGILSRELNRPTAVSVEGKAYIFGLGNSACEIVDLETLGSESIATDLPIGDTTSAAVFDGRHIYIIGGGGAAEETNKQGLIQIDPETLAWSFIPVENFPLGEDQFYFYPPAPVFVEKLRRIYFFGGGSRRINQTEGYFFHDDVWYVDLP